MEFGLKLNLEKWEPVYCASDVDDRVSAFANTMGGSRPGHLEDFNYVDTCTTNS